MTGPVHTHSGPVSGVPGRLAQVTVFKGIPYAASTAGPNRWRAPQPVTPWREVRVADTFGDASPQLHETGPVGQSEDCLNLNVWTAASSAEERRPVLVWIHGGRFEFGRGSDPHYDGSSLAARGLVVVTINYRTGVFGYFASSELSAESGHGGSGNYGLLDAVAALEWVQREIEAFGGDPTRVTLAGHSSGGASTLDLVYSPLGRGLFSRVLVESSALHPRDPAISTLNPSHRTLEHAEQDGEAYAKARGAANLDELRALPVEELLAGSGIDDPRVPGTPPPPLFRPVIDGWVLPRNYWETLSGGRQNDVAVLTGNNQDESGAKPRQEITLAEYEEAVRAKYGAFADEFLDLYPAATDEEAGEQFNNSLREGTRVSTYLWATLWGEHATSPVFTYYWTHTPPGSARGAYHGSEIPYIFGNVHLDDHPYTERDRAIAEEFGARVVNFATTGDPHGSGLTPWAPAGPESPQTLRIGDTWEPLTVAAPAKVDFFARFFAAQQAW